MSVGTSRLRAMVLCGLAALVVVALCASSAWAEASTHCVKATKVSKIISGKTKHVFTGGWNDRGCMSVNATHEGKFEKLASFTEPEEQQLKALLKYVNVQASGVGGKPTVQFSGANVQVVSGAGKTNAAPNGEGNLVIGYDENEGKHAQTGSHNLILGLEQAFTSFGGIVAGFGNSITGEWASVIGGHLNTASGAASSVTAGQANQAGVPLSSVSGGDSNKATGDRSSVSGGNFNTASGKFASVSGGGENTASATDTAVSGGRLGTASGDYASVSGGKFNTASVSEASVSGGDGNVASNFAASISGGEANKASGLVSWIGGGFKNEVFSNAKAGEEGRFASIFGGKETKTAKDYEAIP